MSDNTIIHPTSQDHAHLIDLFLFKGRPINNDQDRQVQVLVNSGYVVGFSAERYQPVWAAYRVAGFDRDVDFDRPHLYYDDHRLEPNQRISANTFGKKDGVQYHVGHMVPNEAINQQFGRLAQLETFFMSNMSPQRGSLNGGVWLKLETAIRDIQELETRDHVWIITGPVFGDDPDEIERPDGTKVPVPEAYFCVTFDPFRYPWNRISNVDIAGFLIPQTAPSSDNPLDYLTTLDVIEDRTGLTFIPGFDHTIGEEIGAGEKGVPFARHRLIGNLL